MVDSFLRKLAAQLNGKPDYWDVTPIYETHNRAVYYCCTFGPLGHSRVVVYRLLGDGCWAVMHEFISQEHMPHWQVAEAIGNAITVATQYI